MIESVLKEIGLTTYEAKVYLALVELGKTTSGEILKKADLKTGKIYEILDSLEKLGLVSVMKENGKKKFSPADPNRVYDYLEERRNKISQQEKEFQNILPELMTKIKSHKEKVNIEIYTGIKGLRSAYYKEFDYFKKGNTEYVIGIQSKETYSKKHYAFFMNEMIPKRQLAPIKVKKLFSEDARGEGIEHEKKAEIRYLPYIPVFSVNIIGKISIIGIKSEEPITIVIESEEVAKNFIQQFELLWKISKK